MGEYSELFVAFDVAKKKHAVAIAEGGRRGEIRFVGDIENSPATIERMIKKLADRYKRLHVCFEAGPTGYELYRQILALGHDCMVVAPALIPKPAGERVKTNRRDAITLARLHRAGGLTAVWVPDATHEAIRDVVSERVRQQRMICVANASNCFRSCCVVGGSTAAAVIGPWRIGVGSPGRRSSMQRSRSCYRKALTRSRTLRSGCIAWNSS